MEYIKSLLGFEPKTDYTFKYIVYGIDHCPSCDAAKCLSRSLSRKVSDIRVDIQTLDVQNFRPTIQAEKEQLGGQALRHRTAPFIVRESKDGKKEFVGGYDDFKTVVAEQHGFSDPRCDDAFRR
jgi:glutaredoxin